MNTERFFHAMSEIDDKYVDEAICYRRKKNKWIRWGALAACVAVVCAATICFLPRGREVMPSDLAPMVYVNDTLYRQDSKQTVYTELKEDFVYLGEVVSDVSDDPDGSAVPDENFEANHNFVGAKIYGYGNDIVVESPINGKFLLFVKLDEN